MEVNTISCMAGTGETYSSSAVDGGWHHLAFLFSAASASVQFAVDGAVLFSAACTQTIPSSTGAVDGHPRWHSS
jgi:hypothetical protein